MKIMFVCTGNTCRSAMAEGLAKKIIKEKKLDIEVYSAGIFAMDGEHASYNSVAIMKEHDVDLALHTATSIENSEIEKMDLILCATKNHKAQLISKYSDEKEKIFTEGSYLLSFSHVVFSFEFDFWHDFYYCSDFIGIYEEQILSVSA